MTKYSSLVSIVSLSLALAILGAAAPAAAAPTQAAQDKLARLHFEAGKQAYELGRFADAAIEFQRGYDLSKLPLFLLNLGHSYFALDRFEEAIKACEQYLALKPNDPVHVREAEDLLTSAQRHKQLQAPPPPPVTTEAPPPVTTEAPAPSPLPETPPPPRRGPAHPALGWTGVVGMVVGVGLIMGGAVLLVDAGNLNDSFNHPAPGTVYNHATVARFQTDQAAGIGLVAAGGAVLVAGTVATIVGFRHAPEAPPSGTAWWVAPSLAPNTVAAAGGFRF